MKKIKRIYVREIGWIESKIQTHFGKEEKWKDNGEIIVIKGFFKQGNTIYPKPYIFAVEYYDDK